MNFVEQKWGRIAIACAVALVVSACGVKSSPATPDGTTFPRTYPAVPKDDQKAKPTTRTVAPGTYQPPPPATQLPQ